MKVQYSTLEDVDAWLALAKEVEPLFGPMVEDEAFKDALKRAISDRTAFCICSETEDNGRSINGGVVVSEESNEIAWLAVSGKMRGKGLGSALLEFAVSRLNREERIRVQTFDESFPEGSPARNLYKKFGFTDYRNGGLNPAGVPTVIMRL